MMSGSYQVIESFTASKSPENGGELNEDAFLTCQWAAAAIDGVTGNTECPPPSPGREAALAVKEIFSGAGPDASPTDLMNAANRALSDIEGEAVAAVFLPGPRKIARVGDVAVGINGVWYKREKRLDAIVSQARVCLLRTRLEAGADVADLSASDPGRKMVYPLLAETRLWGNRSGSLGFPVLNGKPRPPVIDVFDAPLGAEIIFATDGYPFPANTLEKTERLLADYLRDDPLCLGPPAQTKGVSPGDETFDDRTYLRLKV